MSEQDQAGLFKKLAEVMGEVGYVQKRGYNQAQRYNYVTEADLVDAVREKLAERNVIVIPGLPSIQEREITTQKGGTLTVTTAELSFTFCDGDTGAQFTTTWMGSGADAADKGLYKAMTGALKYLLMKTFLVPTGDDPEADGKTDAAVADGRTAKPKQQAIAATPDAPLGEKAKTQLNDQLERFVKDGGDFDELAMQAVAMGTELNAEGDLWEKLTRDQGKALYEYMQGVAVPKEES